MPLHDTDSYIIETIGSVAESLPDPTLHQGRTHLLVNTGFPGAVVYSSVGATPFSENGVNVATISVPVGEFKQLQSDGVRWVVKFPTPALLVPTITTPARTLNTNFTPHATRPVLGIYSVRISGQTTLLSGDEGRIELRADNGAPATPRTQVAMRIAQALGVTVGTQSAVEGELTFLFPPGWQGRLHSVVVLAAPTFSIVRQTEIIL